MPSMRNGAFLSDIDFQATFDSSPNPYVLLDRAFTIVWANREYLRVTMRDLPDIVGRNMFDAFPSEGESYRQLSSSLNKVLDSGEPDEVAHIRYDISDPDGNFTSHIWSATHTPLLDNQGHVKLILQHTVDVTEVEELRRMRDAMGVLRRAQAVEQRYAGVNEELMQLRSLLEQAPGFVAILAGEDHRFVMANAAYRKLIGERKLIGRTVEDALPEIVDQGFLATLDAVQATGEPYFGKRELVKLGAQHAADLHETYLEFIFQPIFGKDGLVRGVFIQGHDVTEEVAAEEHQRLLINELNHRVKNTLAIVQGLAQQSFRTGDNGGALEAFGARLAALASVHNLLTERNWESADIGLVLRRSLEATLGAAEARVRYDGPHFTLPPQPSVALAMVVHELATNALKYGALAREDGRIEIAWRTDRGQDERHIRFEWREHGGPTVVSPETRGFGSRLIGRGFGGLGDSTDLDYRPDGLVCRIEATV